jgi:hypothetical protein
VAPLTGPRKWAYQAFSALPGPVRGLGDTALRLRAEREVRAQPGFGDDRVRLLIGPLNTAGQAWQWARAAEQHLPGVSARSLWAERGTRSAALGYRHDIHLSRAAQLRGQRPHRARVLGASHVLVESGHPVLGDVRLGSFLDDVPVLRGAGVADGLLLHGSEIRDLRQHAEQDPHSPFAGEWDDRLTRMQATVGRTRGLLADYDGPVLVSTPDLLDFVPGATWLPLVVDVEAFARDAQVLRRERPLVLHAPSNPLLKGTRAIEAALRRLSARGVITYRRLEGVPHARMADVIAAADVVVDQVVLGNPGVLLAESLAAGRLVVAHLSEPVRSRMAAADPAGQPVPVVEADPTTIAQVIEQVVADRAAYVEIARQGPAWARRNHDGVRAAQVLAGFLGHWRETSSGGSAPP